MSSQINPVTPDFSMLLKDPRMLLAFGFGSGLAVVVPGTVGTLFSIPFYLLFTTLPLPIYLAIVVLSVLVGIHFCSHASRVLGVHDHKGIVWDEFAGFWISMIAIPLSVTNVVVGFFIFRFFDMVKPWPISYADKKIDGGFGIMIDDVMAGVATCFCLHMLIYFGIL